MGGGTRLWGEKKGIKAEVFEKERNYEKGGQRLTVDLSGSRMLSTLRVRNMTGLDPPLLDDETGGLQTQQMYTL